MARPPKKPLRVAEFKANLSAYLREVRTGKTLTIYDRDTPIVRVVPVESGERVPVRGPRRRHADVRLPPKPLAPGLDALDVLLELRRDRL